jgi:RNA polymerase sigma factor (sigma-70 family)
MVRFQRFRCPRRRLAGRAWLGHNTCVSNDTLLKRTDTVADEQLALCVQAMARHAAAGLATGPDLRPDTERVAAERALSELYDCAVQRVHAMVRRFVHEDSAAQEVTEDVFYQAWTHAPRFDASRGSVMGWLLTMARSRALDAWRKHNAQLVSFDSDAADELLAHASDTHSPPDLLAVADTHHALHRALAEVPPAARQMISLAFFQGLTHSEISEHMQTPLGTVKTTIRRALQSLREHLQDTLAVDIPMGLSLEE